MEVFLVSRPTTIQYKSILIISVDTEKGKHKLAVHTAVKPSRISHIL